MAGVRGSQGDVRAALALNAELGVMRGDQKDNADESLAAGASEPGCCCPFFVSRWQPIRDARMVEQVRSGSGGEQAMAEQKTEKESPEQRKPDAPQLQKHEIDFEELVITGIATVIMKSPKGAENLGLT